MQSTSPSGLTTLKQWKQQIRDSINLLRHGVSGYNRTIRSIDSTLLTKEDIEVLAKENPIDFSIHEDSCPLRERSIQQVNLGNLVATDRLPEKIGNFDLSPDLPVDFSSIEQKRIEGTDSKAIDRMSETLTGIASSQQKMLQLMELQMKKAGILIDKPRGTCQEGEFRLPGQPELSKFLFEKVIDIFKRPDKYAKKKIYGPSPILLYGKPGCGKTSAVKKLVDFIGVYKFEIKLSAVGSKYVHETSCKISEIFRSANILAPSVVIIDEVDTLLSQSLKEDSIRGEEVATLLDLIGEAGKNKILVIGMTNNLDAMSDAAKRPGRFTYHFKVEPLRNGGDVKELLANCWDTISIASNVNIDYVAQKLATKQGGCTVADVYGFSREVCMRAVRQDKEDVDDEVVQEVLDEYLQKNPDSEAATSWP